MSMVTKRLFTDQTGQSIVTILGTINTTLQSITDLGARVTTAEGNITSLGTRMLTAENAITTLNSSVIKGVQVNGTDLSIDSVTRKVNVDLSNYALKTDIVSAYVYRGTVETYEMLATIQNPKVGDVWNVVQAHGGFGPGTNYAWTGNLWDALGGSVDMTNYVTKEQYNALQARVAALESEKTTLENRIATIEAQIGYMYGFGPTV